MRGVSSSVRGAVRPSWQTVSVRGVATRYSDSGNGPLIVLVHGSTLGASIETWGELPHLLRAAGLRVVAFDQPGFGESGPAAEPTLAYRIEHALTFLDALALRNACVVGHSQGGQIAVRIAAELPAAAARVVVMNTGSLLPPAPAAAGRGGAKGWQRLGMLEREPDPGDTAQTIAANVHRPERVPGELQAVWHKYSVGEHHRRFTARMAALATDMAPADLAAAREFLRTLEERAMLLYGDKDAPDMAQRLGAARGYYKGMPVHLIEDAGHFLHLDDPEAVARRIRDYSMALK